LKKCNSDAAWEQEKTLRYRAGCWRIEQMPDGEAGSMAASCKALHDRRSFSHRVPTNLAPK
jgi:hypothetical protein